MKRDKLAKIKIFLKVLFYVCYIRETCNTACVIMKNNPPIAKYSTVVGQTTQQRRIGRYSEVVN